MLNHVVPFITCVVVVVNDDDDDDRMIDDDALSYVYTMCFLCIKNSSFLLSSV